MNRRQLLAAAPGLALLTGCAGTDQSQGAPMPERRLEDFGLQLSTITPRLMADFEGTLAEVAAIGYTQVEFSALGFLGRPVEHVASLLAQNQLAAPVGRVSPRLPKDFGRLSRAEQMTAFRRLAGPDYLLDSVRYGLDNAKALGQDKLVLPALTPDNFTSTEKVAASIDLLQRAGEMCRAEGVRFGYHNHDWELKPVAGQVPYDVMLEQIAPDLLEFQIDVYWITKAGRDPIEYFDNHPGRFTSVHLKDIEEDGDFADVGYGQIDFPAVVAAAQRSGAKYYFVERDNPPQPMQTAQRAYAYLASMTY